MWKLYNLLRSGIENKKYLLHEFVSILEKISEENFLDAMVVMYGKQIMRKSPEDLGILFIKGLRETNFFSFVELTNGLRNR